MRAQWIALRTLHSAVRPLEETVEGKPVFAFGAVRLALPPGAHHFRRIIACEKCGRDMIEHRVPVRRPSDIRRPAHSLVCSVCSQVN
jgi:formylmethanofuran dehydrogenase subunit E